MICFGDLGWLQWPFWGSCKYRKRSVWVMTLKREVWTWAKSRACWRVVAVTDWMSINVVWGGYATNFVHRIAFGKSELSMVTGTVCEDFWSWVVEILGKICFSLRLHVQKFWSAKKMAYFKDLQCWVIVLIWSDGLLYCVRNSQCALWWSAGAEMRPLESCRRW
jgi:hypothetical protein